MGPQIKTCFLLPELDNYFPAAVFSQAEGGGGGDEGRGVTGNGSKFGAEASVSVGSSAAADYNSEDGDDGGGRKKVRRRRRKTKDKGSVSVDEKKTDKSDSSIVCCKKNDGKGWQCKRPANPKHSLCDHHLDLLRNYSSRTNGSTREGYESEKTDQPLPQVKNPRPKGAVAVAKEPARDGGGGGNDYYYYSGFGPWRGKKRSGGSATGARVKEDEDDDGEEEGGEDVKDKLGDGSDAQVAGDDVDDDSNGDDADDLENKGRLKKRGRKRVKARSLKSLM